MNDQLRKSGSSNHLSPSLVYWKDYVVVPPRVWKAFSNWYGKSHTIARKVIVYPMEQLPLRTSVQLVQEKDDRANQAQVERGYELLMHHDREARQITELEIEQVYLKCGKIQENGSAPQTYKDGFFSRKMPLREVLEQLVLAFENKQTKDQVTQEFRFWDSPDGYLGDEDLSRTIEEAGLKQGQKVLVEFKLGSGEYPSDKQTSGQLPKDASRTKGCANLGNTCYMNASLQCMANAPYMREFFTGVHTPNGLNKSVRIVKDKKGKQVEERQVQEEPEWRK